MRERVRERGERESSCRAEKEIMQLNTRISFVLSLSTAIRLHGFYSDNVVHVSVFLGGGGGYLGVRGRYYFFSSRFLLFQFLIAFQFNLVNFIFCVGFLYKQRNKHLCIKSYVVHGHPYINTPQHIWGCPRGVMVKTMDSGIVISEFVL